MGLFRGLRKTLRKVVKVAAIGAAVYYTGGAALSAYNRSREQPQAPQEPQFVNYPYSAPFNPGYSYTGPPESYGAAYQSLGSTGGAAVPSMQGGGDGAPAPAGFTVTPMMGILALVVVMFGFLFLRR